MEHKQNAFSIPRQLVEITGQLKKLISETETQFLSIGGCLNRFSAHTSEVITASKEAAQLLDGEEIAGSIKEMESMLDDINSYISHSEADTVGAKEKLAEILQAISEMRRPIAALAGVLKILRMLGISTRIESSALGGGQGDFHTISDQVKELSHSIKTQSTKILAKEKTLSLAIEQALPKIASFEADRSRRSKRMLEKTRTRLSALKEAHDKCSETAAFVARASQAAAQDINAIVESVQFHDISRQHIEQVLGALYDLCERLTLELDENGFSYAGTHKEADLLKSAHDICRAQAQELGRAGDELVRASNHIHISLKDISQNVSDISEQTRSLAGFAEDAGKTFFTNIETGLTAITDSLTKTVKSSAELDHIMAFLADAVRDMSGFVRDIEDIAGEIEFIALNAQIKAARIGSRGSALGVLAQSIKQLSLHVAEDVGGVPKTLKKIVGAAEGLQAGFDDGSAKDLKNAEAKRISKALATLLAGMRNANIDMVADLANLDKLVRTLVGEINGTVNGLTVDQDAAAVIARTAASLTEIAGRAEILLGLPNLPEPIPAGAAVTEGQRQELAAVGHRADELGENVELF